MLKINPYSPVFNQPRQGHLDFMLLSSTHCVMVKGNTRDHVAVGAIAVTKDIGKLELIKREVEIPEMISTTWG